MCYTVDPTRMFLRSSYQVRRHDTQSTWARAVKGRCGDFLRGVLCPTGTSFAPVRLLEPLCGATRPWKEALCRNGAPFVPGLGRPLLQCGYLWPCAVQSAAGGNPQCRNGVPFAPAGRPLPRGKYYPTLTARGARRLRQIRLASLMVWDRYHRPSCPR